jgi:hypothetical protein
VKRINYKDLALAYDADRNRLKPHLAVINRPKRVENDTPGLAVARARVAAGLATIEEVMRYKHGER